MRTLSANVCDCSQVAELLGIPARVPGLGGRQGGSYSAKAPTLKLQIRGHTYSLQRNQSANALQRQCPSILVFPGKKNGSKTGPIPESDFRQQKNPKTKQPNPKSHQLLSTWFSVLLFQLTNRVTFGVSLNHLKHYLTSCRHIIFIM